MTSTCPYFFPLGVGGGIAVPLFEVVGSLSVCVSKGVAERGAVGCVWDGWEGNELGWERVGVSRGLGFGFFIGSGARWGVTIY